MKWQFFTWNWFSDEKKVENLDMGLFGMEIR